MATDRRPSATPQVATTPYALSSAYDQNPAREVFFCDGWVEVGDDPFAGTNCKLRAGHAGPCSALYTDEKKEGSDAH